eukprot:gene545-937_t
MGAVMQTRSRRWRVLYQLEEIEDEVAPVVSSKGAARDILTSTAPTAALSPPPGEALPTAPKRQRTSSEAGIGCGAANSGCADGATAKYPSLAPPTVRTPLAADTDQCALDLIAAVTAAQRHSPTLSETLSSIKYSFSQRDYAAVFSTPENLLVYMCAYVPSRALCYLNVLGKLLRTRGLGLLEGDGTGGAGPDVLQAWCLGAGPGSEAVAFGTWALLGERGEGLDCAPQTVSVHSFDVAHWGVALQLLHEGMQTLWGNCPAASETPSGGSSGGQVTRGKQAFTSTWSQGDALQQMPAVEWSRIQASSLLTAFFVLDEMWGASPQLTLSFLRELRERTQIGATFLAVDSAGSFSYVKLPAGYTPQSMGEVGENASAWMHAIVDDVFLYAGGDKTSLAVWNSVDLEGVLDHDSQFFRFRKGTMYDGPKLNSYRCWLRLYKRVQ